MLKTLRSLSLVLLIALSSFASSAAYAQSEKPGVRFPAGKSFVEIPLRIEFGVPVISVGVNGSRPLKFILDTGSDTPVLFKSSLADSLKLKISSNEKASVQGGGPAGVTASIATDVIYNLGGVELTGGRLIVLPPRDSSRPSPPTMNALDGIIGRPLFENLIVEYDWDKSLVRLSDTANFNYSGKGAVLPLTFDNNGLPYTTAQSVISNNNQIMLKVFVDTGADNALTLYVYPQSNVKLPERTLVAQAGGVGGSHAIYLGSTKKLGLGNYKLQDVFTSFFETPSPPPSGRQAVLGAGVLRRFNVIFDYSRKQMILEPSRTFKEPFEYPLNGFSYAGNPNAEGIRIGEVFENSPAKEAGLLVGDMIVAINNRPSSGFAEEDLHRLFWKSKKGTELTLKIKRGDEQLEKKIKLNRFF